MVTHNTIVSSVILLAQTEKHNKYIFGAYKDNGEATDFLQLPEDHKLFIDTIRGKQVVMGKETLMATPDNFPDGGRFCVTHHPETVGRKAIAVDSIPKAIEMAKMAANKQEQDRIYVIGGASIIGQCFENNLLDEMRLTLTYGHKENVLNPVFLNFDIEKWRIIEDSGILIAENSFPDHLRYRFLTLVRK